MSNEQPKRVVIRDRIVREVLRDATKKQQIRSKADEEVSYVDTSRSISVVLGASDLGADIKAGKKSDNYEPAAPSCEVYFTQAKNFMAKKKYETALDYLKMALSAGDMKSGLKNGIMCAMAQCHLDLGAFETSKKWAEDVLKNDANYIPAVLIKGESLYNICDFEHAMVVFYTGLQIMKTHAGFKSGIVKCKKTILNTLDHDDIFSFDGSEEFYEDLRGRIKVDEDYISKYATDESKQMAVKSKKVPKITKRRPASSVMSRTSSGASSRRPSSASDSKRTKPQDRLKADKDYLKKLSEGLLINNPDDKIGKKVARGAGNTVDFLNARNQFWKQVQVKQK